MNKHKEFGKIVCELNSSKGNPRNSEGAFLTLKDGRIRFIYSKFTGKTLADNDKSCISSIISSDNGETWWSNDLVIVTPEEHKAKNIMSVSLLRMENGDIGLFYLVRKGWHDMRPYIKRSSDEGVTWNKGMYCIPQKGYYEVNNDRVIMLRNGRIVIPTAFYRIPYKNKYNPSTFRGTAVFYYSDDDGYTWKESREVCNMPITQSTSGLQEPGIVELKNGVLWAWFRTDMGFQYESFSQDGGNTWSQPQPSKFTSCNSPMSMKYFGNKLFVALNPRPSLTGLAVIRNPFVFLFHNGITWSNGTPIEGPIEQKGYSYTAIHITNDKSLLLAYSVDLCNKKNHGIENLRIRKL